MSCIERIREAIDMQEYKDDGTTPIITAVPWSYQSSKQLGAY